MTIVIVEEYASPPHSVLQELLESPSVECLYAISSMESALAKIPYRPPDVVLISATLPGLFDGLAKLKRRLPTVQFLIVNGRDDKRHILQAFRAGAAGYVEKSITPDQVLRAIHDVHATGVAMSPHIMRRVVQHFQLEGFMVRERDTLSPRENEVLELLSEGYVYKEIGHQLSIGSETVRTHVRRICAKLHVRSRLEAVARFRIALEAA